VRWQATPGNFMTRQTSVDAYHKIKDEGLLSARRWEAYDILFRHGPLTANELLAIAKQEDPSRSWSHLETLTKRLRELCQSGVADEVGTKICSITGMTVILWDVTAHIPVKFEKPKRHKCNACNGRGYIEESQAKLF
jgi:hypothetical protein